MNNTSVQLAGDPFLPPKTYLNFHDVLNSSPIFLHEYREKYDLMCVVLDRLETCVKYLNAHTEYPKSEEDFLSFVMFACMVIDATAVLLDNLGIESQTERKQNKDYTYFGQAIAASPLQVAQEKLPNDDRFFQYFRALAFAHPYTTDRYDFGRGKEVQYSPWVIVNSPAINSDPAIKDTVGLCIYSNKLPDTVHLRIPFSSLKEYIQSRYLKLDLATKWAKQRIKEAQDDWKKQLVDRTGCPSDTFQAILEICISRHWNTSYLKSIIRFLECPLTCHANILAVQRYRDALVKVLPSLCDAIERVDEQAAEQILDSIMYIRPDTLHKGASYQLEKIFGYLDEEYPGDIMWGRMQANAFSQEFARKWVFIDADNMSFTEIKLLINTACYLEQESIQNGSSQQ